MINLVVLIWQIPDLFFACLNFWFWRGIKYWVGKDKVAPWGIVDELDTIIYEIKHKKL